MKVIRKDIHTTITAADSVPYFCEESDPKPLYFDVLAETDGKMNQEDIKGYEGPKYSEEALDTIFGINPSDMDWMTSGNHYANTDSGIYPKPDDENVPF